ncbi:MAG: hypothetical protein ABEJ72_10460, partial [Candidatus Aenigmatarchaeota archaeon]
MTSSISEASRTKFFPAILFLMIREKDGIHFEVGDRKFVADSRSAAGDVNIVSHAHMDHVHRSDS